MKAGKQIVCTIISKLHDPDSDGAECVVIKKAIDPDYEMQVMYLLFKYKTLRTDANIIESLYSEKVEGVVNKVKIYD